MAVFLAVYVAALFTPPLLDDADAAHAQVARHIALSGDWVTFQIDGIRYLEKAPLPYWTVAIFYHLFGYNVFATHLPMALGMLGCAVLAWFWARRAFGDRAAFYSALGLLTCIGAFLFTRVYIPEALLSFFTALALYCLITGTEDRSSIRIYWMWAALALGVLTKGLVTPVFFAAAAIPYLILTGAWRRWRELRPLTGVLLFLLIAAPWHILAGLRNPDQGHPIGNIPTQGNVHGFFYFYFINEHWLRFLGSRYPHDYNKLPGYLYWSLHLVWLAPWSIFLPVLLRRAWQTRSQWLHDLKPNTAQTVDFYIEKAHLVDPAQHVAQVKFRARTNWLLAFYAAFILIFFSLSTNQEYYTFPAYFPLLVLSGSALARAEEYPGTPQAWLTRCHAIFALIGTIAAGALAYGLWLSRSVANVPDIGTLLARRDVAGYSLSMSHFFDLTGASFAALREPAIIAMLAFLVGPLIAWLLRKRGHHLEATTSVAFTAAVFLVAAHIALVRFEPLLSSKAIAETINHFSKPEDRLLLYGDQSDGSSVIFYTNRPALLVNGRRSTMIWGSYYPDAPHIFLTDEDLIAMWGRGSQNFLFVPEEWNLHVQSLLGSRAIEVQRLAGKTLYTDRPLVQ
ncbi:Melittin resistance protein PqaB [Acidisarcina polymorpha]|uniref:Melittin resistance protein PqaB n=1 Tax=Acidisarcina polymorpha TaxID=2211140 RepID=A0A2Z5FU74_9BACT|nr:Melittin resistance protein PqaB [Acidisarcina polymorpha]